MESRSRQDSSRLASIHCSGVGMSDTLCLPAGAAQPAATLRNARGSRVLRKQIVAAVCAQQQPDDDDLQDVRSRQSDALNTPSSDAPAQQQQPPAPRSTDKRQEHKKQGQQKGQPSIQPHQRREPAEPGAAVTGNAHAARKCAPARRKRAEQRQPGHVAPGLSVAQWLATVAHIDSRTHPKYLCSAMRSLESVKQAQSEAQRQQVVSAITRLISAHFAGGYRHATFVDAIGTGLAEQPAVRDACFVNNTCSKLFGKLMHAAAHAHDTFTDDRRIAQVATAQRKLRLHSAAYWQRLQERGFDDIGPRQLATLVHCAGVLVDCGVGPAPTAALWDAMQQAVEDKARDMDGQGVANVFLAHAHVEQQPTPGAHKALFSALQRRQSVLVPQAAANIVWAAGKLSMQLSEPQQHLLLKLLQQHTRGMKAQEISIAWLGLAYLEVKLDAQLSSALQAAVVTVAKKMTSQEVANTLWAFVKLSVSAQDHVVAALLQRALDVSDVMSEQQVANMLYAIAKLRLQAGTALREALLRQAEHVAGGMKEQAVANTLWALAEAQIVPKHRAKRCWSRWSASAATWWRKAWCRCLTASRAWACGRASRSETPSWRRTATRRLA